MAVNWSHNMAKLDPKTRKASKNPRPKGSEWASQRAYLIEAERDAALPWARARPQVFPVPARERRRVERQLARDGWTVTRTRRMPRGWVPPE